jgi:hypothetical protein
VNGLWYCSRGCVEQSVLRTLAHELSSPAETPDGLMSTTGMPAADVTMVRQVDEAAALVADAASTQRAVTVRHGWSERCIWVQIEGATRVSNLLVPAA